VAGSFPAFQHWTAGSYESWFGTDPDNHDTNCSYVGNQGPQRHVEPDHAGAAWWRFGRGSVGEFDFSPARMSALVH
jgi:hypothetical protein